MKRKLKKNKKTHMVFIFLEHTTFYIPATSKYINYSFNSFPKLQETTKKELGLHIK
jgi:hypothetical protein